MRRVICPPPATFIFVIASGILTNLGHHGRLARLLTTRSPGMRGGIYLSCTKRALRAIDDQSADLHPIGAQAHRKKYRVLAFGYDVADHAVILGLVGLFVLFPIPSRHRSREPIRRSDVVIEPHHLGASRSIRRADYRGAAIFQTETFGKPH